ncbi:hypothetical protein Vadar_016136 [Vaccinium darrowii]|uniref:Uncharacterized protein n=1 Tax=Vaccinium darrowii TaxID=229202 RepID=A0ACB7XRD4_9ERIC|nr:hypothetical protein Vadar_016136 [Vaccinium darrowii]
MPADTPENAEARRKWKIKCGKALFALRGSISKELIEHIRAKEKPNEIWQLLEQLFTKKHTATLQMLENELANTTQGNMTVAQYFQKIKSICSEISEIDKEEPISEARLRRYLIRGIRKEYMPFLTSIQGWATQPTIIELENLLSNQEALAKQMASNNKKNNQNQQQGHNWKNNQQQGSYWKKKNQQQGGGSQGEIKKAYYCYRCGNSGHIKKYCRTVMNEGNVGAFKNGSGEPSGNREWDTCLSTEILDKRKMSREPVLTSTNASMNVDYKKDWIIDSGCSHHLTGDDSLFSSLQEYKGQDAIVTADNSIHPVKNEGTVKVNASNAGCVTLNSVYHVPGMTKNLVSVSQISNSGKYVLFGPDDVKVLSNIRNMEADILLEGKRVKSLYVLSASDAYIEKTSKQDNASLWHARLAHVGYEKLKEISANKLVDGLPNLGNFHQDIVCEGCQYGKAHRLPFGKSSIKSKMPLELIHSDLLTCPVASYSGFYYMLVLVDDYTSDGREDEQNFSENVISSSLVPEELRGSSSKEVANSEVVQEDSALRRSTRDRKRPEKFKDYHLDIDNCNICECFFAGPIDEYLTHRVARERDHIPPSLAVSSSPPPWSIDVVGCVVVTRQWRLESEHLGEWTARDGVVD